MNKFDELIDADVPGEERDRLEHVHGLLVKAGPPPELPVGLEYGYRPAELNMKRLEKRARSRRLALIAAALVVLGIAFTGGYDMGNRTAAAAAPIGTLALKGTSAAPHARANLDVLPNVGGNWPMTLSVRGLPSVTAPVYYVVWLVRHGKPFAPCGEFVVAKSGAPLTLQLNAPYVFKKGDTWVVMREKYGPHATRTTVMVPRAV